MCLITCQIPFYHSQLVLKLSGYYQIPIRYYQVTIMLLSDYYQILSGYHQAV